VVSGRLEVLSSEMKDGQPQILVNVEAGGSVGEIGFMTRKPHSATVRAPALADVLVINRAQFDDFRKSKPLLAVALYEALLDQVIRRFRSLSDKKDLHSFWL
ncbi:MAG: cyclic nucleotide-binding domain-containing protein, partial [Candidatus Hydrogenedentota bacterium]